MTTPRDTSRSFLLGPAGMGAWVLAVLVSAGSAAASPSYPGQILEYLEKGDKGVPPCPPTCLLCHTSPNGEANTVRSGGFLDALRMAGEDIMPLVGIGGENRIERALAQLEKGPCRGGTAPCNSDNEGLSDMAELRAGTDPSGPGEGEDCPKYGCGARIAPSRPAPRSFDGTLALGALGMLALLVRRRR